MQENVEYLFILLDISGEKLERHISEGRTDCGIILNEINTVCELPQLNVFSSFLSIIIAYTYNVMFRIVYILISILNCVASIFKINRHFFYTRCCTILFQVRFEVSIHCCFMRKKCRTRVKELLDDENAHLISLLVSVYLTTTREIEIRSDHATTIFRPSALQP